MDDAQHVLATARELILQFGQDAASEAEARSRDYALASDQEEVGFWQGVRLAIRSIQSGDTS